MIERQARRTQRQRMGIFHMPPQTTRFDPAQRPASRYASVQLMSTLATRWPSP